MDPFIVQRLDRVVVRTPAPQALFDLFTQQLGLPVAWPLRGSPFFDSAGIHLGNTFLELTRFHTGHAIKESWLYGLAFELNAHEAAFPELAARGVPHTAPMPLVQPDEQGWLDTSWNMVFLGGLVEGSLKHRLLFHLLKAAPLSRWERGSYPTWVNRRIGLPLLVDWVYPNAMACAVEYNQSWRRSYIESSPGFPGLEIVGVAEVQVGARHPGRAAAAWRNLLAPGLEVEPNTFELQSGPRICLAPAPRDGLLGMTWKVRSLNRAVQFLHQQNLLGSESSSLVTLESSKIMGLRIHLTV